MHAPILLQYYLRVKYEEDYGGIGMIDQMNYLMKYDNQQLLYDHIMENRGGGSLQFLRDVLLDGSETLAVDVRDEQQILNNFEMYGPALVATFDVTETFQDKSQEKLIHLGDSEKNDERHGYHSMLLVGWRIDENDEYRFLLQNWWTWKPFVEVDLEYLKNHHAQIYFVITPQHTTRTIFKTTNFIAVEAMDCREGHCYER